MAESDPYGIASINSMASFRDSVDRIRAGIQAFKDNVSQISKLQEQTIGSIGDGPAHQQLENLVRQTREDAGRLRKAIRQLQATGSDSREGQIRANQANNSRDQFLQALDQYRQVEQKSKGLQRNQMERQFRIVKPDATNEEIRTALADSADGQIFQQALLNSNQYGRAQAAYREVQARHEDILRINQTVIELQQLMEEMALKVEQDQVKIDIIEKNTEQVREHAEEGYKETVIARKSALNARQKKVLCFSISVVILLIIALVIGLKIGLNNKN